MATTKWIVFYSQSITSQQWSKHIHHTVNLPSTKLSDEIAHLLISINFVQTTKEFLDKYNGFCVIIYWIAT